MYCHTLMEIDRVFIGFVIYPSLIGITAATWGAWKICSPPGLEGVCYWAISPQDLMFTCFFHLHHFPERNTSRFVFWYHPNFLIINLMPLSKSLQKCQWIPHFYLSSHPSHTNRGSYLELMKELKGKEPLCTSEVQPNWTIVWRLFERYLWRYKSTKKKQTIQGALAASWESVYIYIYIYTNCLGRIWSCIMSIKF